MAKKKVKKENGPTTTDLIEVLTPLIEVIGPILENQNKVKAPIVRRSQWMNFTIMCTIIVSLALLAYYNKIDGSAATGLIGTIIGYVFGHIYAKKDKN